MTRDVDLTTFTPGCLGATPLKLPASFIISSCQPLEFRNEKLKLLLIHCVEDLELAIFIWFLVFDLDLDGFLVQGESNVRGTPFWYFSWTLIFGFETALKLVVAEGIQECILNSLLEHVHRDIVVQLIELCLCSLALGLQLGFILLSLFFLDPIQVLLPIIVVFLTQLLHLDQVSPISSLGDAFAVLFFFSLEQGLHPFLLLVFHELLHLVLLLPDFIDLFVWQDVGLNVVNLPPDVWILHLIVFIASRELHHVICHFPFFWLV